MNNLLVKWIDEVLIPIEMFTRSRAKAEREFGKTIVENRRSKLREKLAKTHFFVSPYYLRSTMGRRGRNTSKGSGTRSNGVDTSEVPPVRLFATPEEETNIDEKTRQV